MIVAGIGMLSALCMASIGWVARGLVESLIDSGGEAGPSAPGDPAAQIGAGAGAAVSLVRASGLCALPVALLFGYLALRALRYGAWLHGTTAVFRSAFTTRRADLSTASVRGDTVTHAQTHGHHRYIYSIAVLAARGPASGTEVKIPLRGQGLKRLPAGELLALADAVAARRNPNHPGNQDALRMARALRDMAANPFPV